MFGMTRQIQCVKRELDRRKKMFPRYVEEGKMKQDFAESEIAVMQEVYETLTQLQSMVMKG